MAKVPEQIAANLRKLILREEYLPGDLLPPERQLAQRFGTNRNTLREAMRSLESLGLVQVRQGRGVTVRSFREEGRLELVSHFLLEGRNPAERVRVLVDLLDLRRVVLGEIVSMAAVRGGPTMEPRLRERLDRVRTAMEGRDPAAMMQAELDLYREIVRATGSLLVMWAFNTFHELYTANMREIATLWVVPKDHMDGLGRLVDAIAAGEPGEAKETLIGHLERGDSEVLRMLEPFMGRPSGEQVGGTGEIIPGEPGEGR